MFDIRPSRSTALVFVLVLACSDDEVDPDPAQDTPDGPYCEQEPPSTDVDAPVWTEPTCTVAPGSHAAALCSSGACPITTDVVLGCDREFTQLGLRVAASEASAYLLSSSDDRAMLLTASGSQGTLDAALPLDFPRQTALLDRGLAGELYVAAETTLVDADPEGEFVVLRGEQGVWSLLATDPLEESPFARIHDLTSDGSSVHAWYDAGLQWPMHFTYTFSNSQPAAGSDYPITPGSWTHWTLDHAGLSVSFSFAEQPGGWQLGARQYELGSVMEVDSAIGSPVVACSPLAYRPVELTKPSAPEVTVPSYAVVIQHPDGLRIAWPSEEFGVPDTSLATVACTPEEQVDGEARGLVVDGFGVAQTTDGRLWLGWIDAPACAPEQDSTLHVSSFDFVTRELTKHVELAIDPLAPIVRPLEPGNARMVDLQAWATHLAIGLRLREGGGPAVARLIQIDTSML
jgi:hypothetical protein